MNDHHYIYNMQYINNNNSSGGNINNIIDIDINTNNNTYINSNNNTYINGNNNTDMNINGNINTDMNINGIINTDMNINGIINTDMNINGNINTDIHINTNNNTYVISGLKYTYKNVNTYKDPYIYNLEIQQSDKILVKWFQNDDYTPMAQVIVAYIYGVLLSPLSSGIFILAISIIVYEILYYIFSHGKEQYYNVLVRAGVISASILGYICGKMAAGDEILADGVPSFPCMKTYDGHIDHK